MARLTWDDIGTRFFEAGVDRGVLYVDGLDGVPWNGLVRVGESPSSDGPSEYYIDGYKYLIDPSLEDFKGTIEAFSYPDEFELCQGYDSYRGVAVTQQKPRSFGFSYRTQIGSDTDSIGSHYKIHLVYNAYVSPTSRDNETLGESVDPNNFSWDFITQPEKYESHSAKKAPTAHIIVDSRKTSSDVLETIEDLIYGTKTTPARLPSPFEMLGMVENVPLRIEPETDGVGKLTPDHPFDLVGRTTFGVYTQHADTRLKETSTSGIFTLEE